MNLLNDYSRVSRGRACPVCGKPDWCLISRDDPPSKVICARVQSKTPVGEAGWLHKFRDDGWRHTCVRTVTVRAKPNAPRDFGDLARTFQRSVDPGTLADLAASLGVKVESLVRLGIGWNGRAWTFPMSDASGRVLGIRLRFPDATKLAVKGGHEGLFIPNGPPCDGPLLLAEGPTDTAALLSLGLNAIGRPSCSGGVRLVIRLVRMLKPCSVVVVADADVPGQKGAERLAFVLTPLCRSVRVISPPTKDIRAWVNAGATRQQVERLIDAALPRHLRAVALLTAGGRR